MQRYVFILFLPILTVRDVLQLAGVTPAADDAVGGARIDTEGCGEFGVCLAVEIWWEGFEELALLESGSCGDRGCKLSRVCFWKGEEDVGVVTKDYRGHRHCALVVGVEAGQSVLDDAIFHYAEADRIIARRNVIRPRRRTEATNSSPQLALYSDCQAENLSLKSAAWTGVRAKRMSWAFSRMV